MTAHDLLDRVKQPHSLSPRIQWLRDHFFRGLDRPWNNEFACFSTGTAWDVLYEEMSYYIVPETYAFLQPFRSSALQAATDVPVPRGFWRMGIAERRAWFIRECLVEQLPQEVLPGSLIVGARFNLLASRCWDRREARARDKAVAKARKAALWFHRHGYGNAGPTSGHLVPDHERLLRIGWKGVHDDLEACIATLSRAEDRAETGTQLRAMLAAATTARDLAARYASLCRKLARDARDDTRRAELEDMSRVLDRVPWEPAETFHEGLQALWLNHALVLSDECYPGAGVSFGRVDQYLLPHWQRSLDQGMDREWGKELLRSFWVQANHVYDAMIKVGGNQGITAGFGQLVCLSGLGSDGRDMTNDLTWAILEVIDELSPILEPKPNVRLHRGSPPELLDRVVDMIAASQGAPFLLNFDERSMAGMLRQAKKAGVEHLIHPNNVHDYVSVGCLENTMAGNDRSGTVDINLELVKAVELALTGGKDLLPAVDPITGAQDPIQQDGPATGDAVHFYRFEQLWDAYATQTRAMIRRAFELYDEGERIRATFSPTPYLSCLVRGCAESGKDVTQGGAELGFVTIEAIGFATAVDSLLAVKHLVFDTAVCTLAELTQALRDNWEGHEVLQARAKYRAPKYGRDDPDADALARRVMHLWTEECWKYTTCTGRQLRPGMLSWNYWVGDGYVLAATADGRPKGRFLSNAICPTNGADIHGPTANANSVGTVLGGHAPDGKGDWEDYRNCLPNGASHTITFHPALMRDAEHREKFRAYLLGYARNGGTALQVNVLDAEILKEAQRRPQDFRHLLVRVTGYNAYFTSIGRELQDEIIARENHRCAT